ncbi:MAG: NUDIX hydrolase [Candidatus Margulisbacteria bacterium]|jgi:ADP-ribose pyrophosphatase YjhB (NUDIX family)|nr:NUDIX hydrolase [Candidatus Margulisiibacteriota bacterium]
MIDCHHCTSHLIEIIPSGDTLLRKACKYCNTIFYENPKIIAGVMPIHNNKILLCKRNIEPKKNFWTVPSGFMELNETLQQAAIREAQEEAGITPVIHSLHTIYDMPSIGQVYMLFLGHCSSLAHEPGIETIESQWVPLNDIPWDELAFSSVEFALQRIHEPGPHFGALDAKKPSK